MLFLASTSKYRKSLLEKTGWNFQCLNPNTNEEAIKQKLIKEKKSPLEIAESLSKAKAQSAWLQIASENAIVIAGDQLVNFKNEILGKPGSEEKAIAQIKQMSGQSHQLITAVTIQSKDDILHLNHMTTLHMKQLSDDEIRSYIQKDQPFDCAGSYKIEEHGVCLFESIDCDDFSAIQGLPLIWITNELRKKNYELFK